MKFTYADTKNIEDIGRDIIDLANEYNLEITNLFKDLTNAPYDGHGGWEGSKAAEYAEFVSLDKQEYLSFGDAIKAFGNKIVNASNDVTKTVKKSEGGTK